MNYPIKLGHKNPTFMGCFLLSNIQRRLKSSSLLVILQDETDTEVVREFGIARELIREWSRLYERWGKRPSILSIQLTRRYLNWAY